MTLLTDWNHIEPVLEVVTFVVMVFGCLIIAGSALELSCRSHATSLHSPAYGSLRPILFGVPFSVRAPVGSTAFQCLRVLLRFKVGSVRSLASRIAGGVLTVGLLLARFAEGRQPVCFACIFPEVRSWLPVPAAITEFGCHAVHRLRIMIPRQLLHL